MAFTTNETIVITVRFDPTLVTEDFITEHIEELEGIESATFVYGL